MNRSSLAVFLLLGVLLSLSICRAGAPSLTAQCDQYAATITSALAKGDYLGAIAASADYEEMLDAQYPTSTFTDGTYRNQALHLSLSVPLKEWEQIPPPQIPYLTLSLYGGEKYLLHMRDADNAHFLLESVDTIKSYRMLDTEKVLLDAPVDTRLSMVAGSLTNADTKFKVKE